MRDQPCRVNAIMVFKIKTVDYADQYGFERRERVRGETRTLTLTGQTETFEYYGHLIPCKVAVDGDGLEYVESAITDFGPSSKLWRARDKSGPWYQRYSGRLGVEAAQTDDPRRLADVQTRTTGRGSEYAALPICCPIMIGPPPHGWMGVVNGHLTGIAYDTEAEALANAELLANSECTRV